MNPEEARLKEARERTQWWRHFGPYLSERAWGSVREDYSPNGDAWNYFPFDMAAHKAFRWGEDGILGISDSHQRLCFAFAFWNGRDPILKERLFGLSNEQGNHGEDVKECYYYLDSTPTHSYMRGLYKYPQSPYPYEALKNHGRGCQDPELELIDTGVFDQDRYFDIFVEYAKGAPDDILIRCTVHNRGAEKGALHLLPTLWLRNTWAWGALETKEPTGKIEAKGDRWAVGEEKLGAFSFYARETGVPLFTENETNFEKLYQVPNRTPYVKDAFHEWLIHHNKGAINPALKGTKGAHYLLLEIEGGGKVELAFRLTKGEMKRPFADFDKIFAQRKKEADQFYDELASKGLSEELKGIQRQAFAGLLWSKQFYHYVVEEWLQGDDPNAPPPKERKSGRNHKWKHFYTEDILSMPDKWEYPWFASWDLAFHCISFALIDPDFAKRQISLMTREWYMHPNGQIPAYEWNFEDVNPPVLAWSAWRVYKIDGKKKGVHDRAFLEQIFQKFLLAFTWWVNRKDAGGRNVFEGGFLGLDNISLFNRSCQFPEGMRLVQSDATSWMANLCLTLWTMAIELAEDEPSYEDMASKFFEHFLFIADAINYETEGEAPLWNEEDGLYYDRLQKPDGSSFPIKVHSIASLFPIFAVATLSPEKLEKLPQFRKRFEWFLAHRPDLCSRVACLHIPGQEGRYLLSILKKDRLTRLLSHLLDEEGFLSPFGIRSVSKYHQDHPYSLKIDGHSYQIDYEPAESKTRLFGGNSNWRGPIWFPLNYLMIESLQRFHYYFGPDYQVEFPARSKHFLPLDKVAQELSCRLIQIFQKDPNGRRPFRGSVEKFQKDPHFAPHLLFNEYFHGDTGVGLGASHQTGWTALIAKLIQQSGSPLFKL